MRAKLIESNKPERYIHSVRNADTTTQAQTIPTGTPLILNISATPQPAVYTNGLPPGWEDGLQVVLPSTAGAANGNLFAYGVAAAPIVFPALGESVMFGVAQAAILRNTRAASTASWTSVASSSAANFALSIDTVNNVFAPGTAVATGTVPYLLLDNLSSMAGSNSSPGDTRTGITQLFRAFIRLM